MRESPEALELRRKRADLAALELSLIDAEEALLTRQAAVERFAAEYGLRTTALFATRDALRVRLAEKTLRRNPTPEAASALARAQEDLRQSSDQAVASSSRGSAPASVELRKAYREAALLLHPDLASSEAERARRTAAMVELNDAFQLGDMVAIQRLVASRAHSPEEIDGAGDAADLVRAIRKISQVSARLEQIAEERAALDAEPIAALYEEQLSRAGPPSVIDEVALSLEREVARLERAVVK